MIDRRWVLVPGASGKQETVCRGASGAFIKVQWETPTDETWSRIWAKIPYETDVEAACKDLMRQVNPDSVYLCTVTDQENSVWNSVWREYLAMQQLNAITFAWVQTEYDQAWPEKSLMLGFTHKLLVEAFQLHEKLIEYKSWSSDAIRNAFVAEAKQHGSPAEVLAHFKRLETEALILWEDC